MSKLVIFSDAGGDPDTIIDTVAGTLTDAGYSIVSLSEAVRLANGRFATNALTTLSPINIYTWDGNITFTQVAQFNAGANVIVSYGLNIDTAGNNFWGLINQNVTFASIYKFDQNGNILVTKGPVNIAVVQFGTTMCVNSAETIMYFDNNISSKIQRWDLVGNVVTTDWITYNINWTVECIFQIQGSTDIIVGFNNFNGVGDNTRIIARYTAAGANVYSVVFHTIPAPSTDDISEFTLSSDLVSLWTRSAGPPSYDINTDNRYHKLSFADGSTLSSIDIPTKPSSLGGILPPITCPILELSASSASGHGGLYYINPNHRRDSYYSGDTKIPDPTIRTALIGE